MFRTRLFWTSSFVAAVLFAHSLASAADYYFDSVAGDDTKDGSTESNAKKTLKMPTGSGHTVHLKRGSSWTMSLNISNATVVAYGCGNRAIINGSISVNSSTVSGIRAMPTSGNGFNIQSNSTLTDSEADGTNCTASVVGMGVMGENNKILGNYVHDFGFSQSGSTMNNSGGAEGIMVMASNNEVGFNSIVNCQSVNTTLGGFEGGCMEIVNNKGGGQAISNVSFHHNYCEKSVGLWEGCSGDFSSTGGSVLTNHAIIENVTVSYNVSVDSMWLFLLQPVNTDFKNVVFANNTIIHTPQSAVYWDSGGGHFSMALAVDTDNTTGTTIKADNQYFKQGSGFQAGSVILKNNIFVDNISSTRQVMFLTNMVDHGNNLFVPASASVGFAYGATPALVLASTEKKVDLAALAFTADYQLTSSSTPAIDQGAMVDMNASASVAATAVNATIFASTFNQDVAKQSVPCGSVVDIGASEYCAPAKSLAWPNGNPAGCGTGGNVGTGGSTSAAATGGTPSAGSGGALALGTGGSANAATGGLANGTGGALAMGTGGTMNSAAGGIAGLTGGAPQGIGGASPATGGLSGQDSTGGSSSGASEAGSCSCRLADSSRQSRGYALVALLALVGASRRRFIRGRTKR